MASACGIRWIHTVWTSGSPKPAIMGNDEEIGGEYGFDRTMKHSLCGAVSDSPRPIVCAGARTWAIGGVPLAV